jgi:hypothetical protein
MKTFEVAILTVPMSGAEVHTDYPIPVEALQLVGRHFCFKTAISSKSGSDAKSDRAMNPSYSISPISKRVRNIERHIPIR